MLQFSSNISFMFQEYDFSDRFKAAKSAGFDSVEFSAPNNMSGEKISQLLDENELKQVLATVPSSPDSKGLAAIPDKEAEFRDKYKRGVDLALAGNAPLLHVTSGLVDSSDYKKACCVFEKNIQWAVEQADGLGIQIVVEAINQHSVPGYFIRSLDDACQWAKRINHLGLVLDLYHAGMEGLDINVALENYLPFTDHIQLAGIPNRNEPNKGRFQYYDAINYIDSSGYLGWVGCEYVPEADTLSGLSWMKGLIGGR